MAKEKNLVQKLIEEKFNGQIPKWEEGNWSGISVMITEDINYYYYKQGENIFVQRKEGSNEEVVPYCFDCDNKVSVLVTSSGPIHGRKPGEILSEGGTAYRFHCINCQGKPEYGSLKEITIQD
ncbi:hypothetical protein J4404_00735 [Candidatus Woesearchaeota archaeon]|nr:hypothetical protein [Candidatus Woesearchaeota archaeon]